MTSRLWTAVLVASVWLAASSPALAVAPHGASPSANGGFAALAGRYGNLPYLGQTVTEEEYWQLIDDTLSAVRQARLLPPAQQAPALEQAAHRLEGITAVRLPNGQDAPVDNTGLLAALRADEPGLDQLEARLDALLQAGRTWQPVEAQPGAFDQLARVLARPEFQEQPARQPPSLPAWLEELLDYWLPRLLMTDRSHALGINWAVLLVGIVVLAGTAYFFWRNVRAHLVHEAALAEEALAADGLSASSAARQARELAAGADYRQAIRYMYLAALLALDERGVLRYDKALTNREVLRRAEQSAGSGLAQAMSPVVDTFDRVWYGFAHVDDETYQAYAEQVSRMMGDK